MPAIGEPLGAQRLLPGRFSDLRGVVLAALLAAAVAGAIATIAPGEDVRRAPATLPAVPAPSSAGTALPATHGSPASESATRAYAQLPLAFEPNRGQSDRRVRFLARGAGYGLFLTATEAVLSLQPKGLKPAGDAAGFFSGGSSGALGDMSGLTGSSQAKQGAVLRFGLLGANANAKIAGAHPLPGKSNYMLGKDPRGWQSGVPNYARVRYASVYPGTDLLYYGRQGKLEYDFVLSPGAEPGRIGFSVAGAKRVSINRGGDLVLQTAAGDVLQRRPFVYQRVGSHRRAISGRYVLTAKNRVGFRVGAYDRSRALVIDPVISYSSYLGGSATNISGSGTDSGNGIAVDSTGTYVTGSTQSADFPTESPYQGAIANANANDAFVTKLNATGSELVYSTYLGGTGGDSAAAIAVDGSQNAYVTGNTQSTNFPTAATGAPVQPTPGNPNSSSLGGNSFDAFVAKLSATGLLAYSTYLGGSNGDVGTDITVDAAGTAYVTGYTSSSTSSSSTVSIPFPTKNSLQAFGGVFDAFVSKLTFSGVPLSDLVYSTYLGGSDTEYGYGIAVDSTGSAYLTGSTDSTNFPTESPLQPANGGADDAFVSKLTFSGTALSLAYSTYLGGSGGDEGRGIAAGSADSAGSAYVTGFTGSSNFPTASPLQQGLGGGSDAFVSKLDAAGALRSSSYLGGSTDDRGFGIAVDSAGSAYVAGQTDSDNFPKNSPAQATIHGAADAFVSKLSGSPALSTLAYSTFLGGSGQDRGNDVAVDSADIASVAGSTFSTDFPTANPFQDTNEGVSDAFVTKLRLAANLSVSKTDTPDPVVAGNSLTYTLSVANTGPDVAQAVSVSDPLPAGVTFLSAPDCSLLSRTVTCSLGDVASGASVQRVITVSPDTANAALSNTASVASSTFDHVAANNSSTSVTEVRAVATPPPGGDTTTPPPGSTTQPTTTTTQPPSTTLLPGVTPLNQLLAAPFTGCPALSTHVVRGSAAANTLTGTASGDRIFAGAGNDVVNALAGNDCVDLGRGADRARGATGKDLIRGGIGNDRIFGDSGDDRISGDSGDDKLTGGRGRDGISGGAGRDTIDARDGSRDSVSCGRGRDTVRADRVDRVARDCERVRRVG